MTNGVTIYFNVSSTHACEMYYKALNYNNELLYSNIYGGKSGSVTPNYTGLAQFRFRDEGDFWTGTPYNESGSIVTYDFYYASPDSGNTMSLVNTVQVIPFTSTLAYYNDTSQAIFYTDAGTSIDGFMSTWVLPDESQEVNWAASWSLYDGSSYQKGSSYANVTVDGYGSMSVGMYMTVGTVAPNWHEQLSLTTAIGHVYYVNVNIFAYNSTTGAYVDHLSFTLVIREAHASTANTSDWIMGIVWMLIIFIPPWLLNWIFPRYGLFIGLSLMMGVLAFTQPGGIWVSFVGFVTIGCMALTMRGD